MFSCTLRDREGSLSWRKREVLAQIEGCSHLGPTCWCLCSVSATIFGFEPRFEETGLRLWLSGPQCGTFQQRAPVCVTCALHMLFPSLVHVTLEGCLKQMAESGAWRCTARSRPPNNASRFFERKKQRGVKDDLEYSALLFHFQQRDALSEPRNLRRGTGAACSGTRALLLSSPRESQERL